MNPNLLILLSLSILIMSTECSFFRKEAKRNINIRYIRMCETDKDSAWKLLMNFNKFNRTHFGLSFNVTTVEPFDSSYSMAAEVAKWGDGGWKENYMNYQWNYACVSMYLYLGPAWAALLDAVHAEQGCPVKPGFYYLENLSFDLSKAPLTIEPGQFYHKTKILQHGKVVVCIYVEIEALEIYTYDIKESG